MPLVNSSLERPMQWCLQLHSAAQAPSPGKEAVPVTFNMTGFTMKKKANKVRFSDSFYSSAKGYKVCLRIDAKGFSEGEGTHCSATLKSDVMMACTGH